MIKIPAIDKKRIKYQKYLFRISIKISPLPKIVSITPTIITIITANIIYFSKSFLFFIFPIKKTNDPVYYTEAISQIAVSI